MVPADPAFAPFTRHDQYGLLGREPQPLSERLRQLLMLVFVVPFKALGTLTCLLSFFAVCKLAFLIPSERRPHVVAWLGKLHCRWCLFWLGFVSVKWVTVPEEAGGGGSQGGSATPEPPGIVSNHCSSVDILLHMSRHFPAFVARDTTKTTPLIGVISRKMDCMYVDRDTTSKDPQNGVASLVRQRMQETWEGRRPGARPILLFPEGTTTNGRYLLPFKTGAFLAGLPLRPVIIQYGKGRMSPAWEMIRAPRHIFLLLCNFHSVTCYELPTYYPDAAEREDPKLYASNVRKKMLEFSGLKDCTSTYADKMRLMAVLRPLDAQKAAKKAA